DQLRRAALATLRAEFPGCCRGVRVGCSAAGLLTVVGATDADEQKLRVSQRLRRLPGGAGGDNQLQVEETAALARACRRPGSVSARLPLPLVLSADQAGGVPPEAISPQAGGLAKAVPPDLQDRLRRRVQQACPEAVAVEVLVSPQGDVAFRLRVATPFDGER